MVGVDQSGVSDIIEFVLNYYPPDVQQRLVEVQYQLVAMPTIHAEDLSLCLNTCTGSVTMSKYMYRDLSPSPIFPLSSILLPF